MGRALAEAAVRRTLAEVATVGPLLLATATAWDPVPTRSKVVGSSIDMTIVARIDLTIVARIGTAITGATLRTVAPAGIACGHPRGGAKSGCAATSARPMGTAITSARPMGTATSARPMGTTTSARPTALIARPTDLGPAVAERERQTRPAQAALRQRRAGEPFYGSWTPIADHDGYSRCSATGKFIVSHTEFGRADAQWQSRFSRPSR